MKQLNYVCCQPDDFYFVWQVQLWVENLKERGESDKAIVLIFTPRGREVNREAWQPLLDIYPEVQWVFYKDEHDVSRHLFIYIPVLRPYLLWRYWTDHPEMEQRAVMYYDCDALLTEEFDISTLINDDICYLSDTNSYINSSYFDSKQKDVLADKLEQYKRIDVLDEATKLVGINRQIAEANKNDSGGAQYLLKNINAEFWHKVMEDCIKIRTYLHNDVNKTYFENESKGFQSWCADMWSVLWNLWYTNHTTRVVKEMDFAWVCDPIEKLKTHKIFHNAGATSEMHDGYPVFYKAKYHTGANPMTDTQIDVVLAHEESKKHCTWWYAKKLDKLRKKYPLLWNG